MTMHPASLSRLAATFLAVSLLAAPTMAATEGDSASVFPRALEGHGGPVRSVALSQAVDKALTSSFDYSAILWAIDDGEGRELLRLEGHDAAVNDALFVPGSDRAVTVSDDGSLAIWDLATSEMLKRFQGPGDKYLAADVSDDGRFAASAGWDGTARLYDIASLTETAVLEGHRGNVNDVDFSPDSRTLYSASYDGTIRAWDVETGTLIRQIYSHGWGLNIVRALPDGENLLYGSLDGSAGIVEIETGNTVVDLAVHQGPILTADISTQSGLALLGGADGTVRVYRTADWILLHTFENPNGPIWGAALSPDGTAAILAGLDDSAFLWQITPRKAFEPPLGDFPRRFQVQDDADPGELQFARKCSVCHTLTRDGGNRAGPTLYGVFGRKAGTLEGYAYSDALKKSDIVWTEETIALLFDDGPDVVTPGSKMPVQRLKTVEDRDALIAFLKRATEPEAPVPGQ